MSFSNLVQANVEKVVRSNAETSTPLSKTMPAVAAIQRVSKEPEGAFESKPAILQTKNADEEEPVQGVFETIQKVGATEEEPLQGKFVVAQKKGNDTGMPDKLKSGIENLSGFAMDDVKVHYNSQQPSQLNALAYAQGSDIHIAPGQEKHLPHEAWHVAQQKQGRVEPTMQLKEGVPVNDDIALETEADIMGAKAVS